MTPEHEHVDVGELPEPPVGAVVWTDLTVEDASGVRDFYAEVVGWEPHEHPMEGYADFVMALPDGEPVSGICHRRGPNANVPALWLPYVRVAALDDAVEAVRRRGGTVVDGPRSGFAVVADPAGAHLALFDPHHATADDDAHADDA